MPYKCTVGRCSNINDKRLAISLHRFPKDSYLSTLWVRFVKITRSDFNINSVTKHTHICSMHFTEESFEDNFSTSKLIGFDENAFRRRLLSTAVPTIAYHERSLKKRGREQEVMAIPKKRKSYLNLEKKKTLRTLLCEEEGQVSCPGTNFNASTSNTSDNFEPQMELKRNKGIQTLLKPQRASKKLQVSVQLQNVAVQCNLLNPTVSYKKKIYLSKTPPANDLIQDLLPRSSSNPSYFIVHRENLLRLFCACNYCNQENCAVTYSTNGTLVNVSKVCNNESCKYYLVPCLWKSQDYLGLHPSFNITLSAAIFCTGLNVQKVINLFNHLNVACYSYNTYFRHQRAVLQPSVLQVWKEEQCLNISKSKSSGSVIVGGDGRCDSPGHTAKYSSYTVVDLKQKKILEINLVQKTEVANSYQMELEGLKRCLDSLEKAGVLPQSIVTDQHSSVIKWLRTVKPGIVHYFDVWHVAKNLKKKLTNLSKSKSCSILSEWIQSISNHVYWVASSTPSGNGAEMVAKFNSVLNHIVNIHDGRYNLLPCSHDPSYEFNKKWLDPESEAYFKLEKCLSLPHFQKALQKLSPLQQTSSIEAFHSLVNQFAPKMIAYSYAGLYCRLLVAALHFNENCNRSQRTGGDGKPKYTISFPRSKSGGYTVRKSVVDPTYEYVWRLMSQIMKNCLKQGENQLEVIPSKPPVCGSFNRPHKDQAIKEHMSRFNNLS